MMVGKGGTIDWIRPGIDVRIPADGHITQHAHHRVVAEEGGKFGVVVVGAQILQSRNVGLLASKAVAAAKTISLQQIAIGIVTGGIPDGRNAAVGLADAA